MNKIKRFIINGLFSYQKVEIPFESNIKILIGENGLGKTTILNSLYYLLKRKWNKLVKVPFESIELEFEGNVVIYFTKRQLEAFLVDDNRQRRRGNINIMNKLKIIFPDVEELKDSVTRDGVITHQGIYDFIIRNKIGHKVPAPSSVLVDCIMGLITDDFVQVFSEINKIIDEKITSTVLYFPTYRRVEEELQNLGKLGSSPDDLFDLDDPFEDEEDKVDPSTLEDETLIQFGMEDVELRIKNILAQINDSSLTGFTKVTGELLSQMLKGFPGVSEEALADFNKDEIKIILNRVKGNLSQVDRDNILGIVESKKLVGKKDLVFFLSKLIEIYRQQKKLDDSIKTFAYVCNKYLVGKEIVFDDSLVSLEIKRSRTDERVKLNQLSSGEKQIVSLFSKIYLEPYEDIIVLLDEPELSLSIKWQEQLLPDILDSKKCQFLLAVTHSPFIFKNELDRYAVGMNVFID